MSDKIDETSGIETTGHEWDGIKELNNPLPKWWLYTFYACIVWAVIYSIAYPAWPMVNRATAGFLGFSTRAQVAETIKEFEDKNAALRTELAAADLNEVIADPSTALHNFAVQGGGAIFRANCSQCHGSGAAGAKGFPNLLDDDWLWGGTVEEIAYTVANGVRNEQSDDAHYSEMTAFGRDEILSKEEIAQVVQNVMQISGQEFDAPLAAEGAVVFEDNCAACHGEDGTGDVAGGAPNLTDAIWLYGGDVATVTETVTNARFGVMPAWAEDYRVGGGLSQDEINAVAVYVHTRGGGQ